MPNRMSGCLPQTPAWDAIVVANGACIGDLDDARKLLLYNTGSSEEPDKVEGGHYRQYLVVLATSVSPARLFSSVGFVKSDLWGNHLDTTSITWCGLNEHPKLNLKESKRRNDTLTETCKHLPLYPWQTPTYRSWLVPHAFFKLTDYQPTIDKHRVLISFYWYAL